jgi:GntR family transcriptional regulator
MILTVDTASSTPVYAQIVDQVKRAIAHGILRSGDALPSLRETAMRLRINHLTVSKAYKLLEHEGLLETRHGLGSFVAPGVQTRIGDHRRHTLAREMDSLLVDACHMSVSFDEVKQLLEERIKAANDGFARDYAKAREENAE